MTGIEKTNLKIKRKSGSLAVTLLKYIAGLYTLVTVILTVWQLVSEYNHVSESITEELKGFRKTFEPALAVSMWNLDDDALRQSLIGMNKIDSIVGIKIDGLSAPQVVENLDLQNNTIIDSDNIDFEEEYFIGMVSDENDLAVFYSEEGEKQDKNQDELEKKYGLLMSVNFPILYFNEEDETTYLVGYTHLFTGSSVVFNRVKYGFFLIILNSVIKTLALWIIFVFFIKMLVSNPLKRLKQEAYNFNPENKDFSFSSESLKDSGLLKRDDELGSLASSLESMRMALLTRDKKILDYSENLEKKVQERTLQLKQKSKDIQNMLESMHQGVFTVMDNSLIHHEYSRHLEEILELKEIAGKNIHSLLFAKSSLSKDQRNQIEMAIDSIIGDGSVSFDLNEHLLVNELDLYFEDNRVKQLEITWEAIKTDDDLVEKMLVIVKDMTEIKGLQQEAEKQKEKLRIIEIILTYGLESFERFYKSSSRMIKFSIDIINEIGSGEPSKRQMANLFRKMHTIKGNARTFGLQEIANESHSIEELYKDIGAKNIDFNKENLLKEINIINEHLEHLNDLVKTKFKNNQVAETQKLHQNILETLMTDANSIGESTDTNLNIYALKSIEGFKLMTTKSFREIVEESSRDLDEIALDLNKFVPEFNIIDNNIRILNSEAETLNNVFMHLVRNSIDHGIEEVEIRKSMRKPDAGTIKISVFQDSEKIQIEYEDDGKGLNLAALREKMREINPGSENKSDELVAELIFRSGVSTSEKVTDISGRGVGMDAVKSFIEEKGGSIQIVLGEQSTDYPGYRNFKLLLSIPGSFGLKPLFSWAIEKKAA